MAEMCSLYTPLLVKGVAVTPNVFELKKCRFCASSFCNNSHHGIIFGDLSQLKRASDGGLFSRYCVHRSDHDFSLGNYSISVLNQEEAKPMVIFHHENFDPSLLASALLDGKDKNGISVVEMREFALELNDGTVHWRPLSNSSYNKSINKDRNGNDHNCARSPGELASRLKLVRKLDPTDAENTAVRAPRLDGLFYFLNAAAWFEYYTFRDPCPFDTVEISALTGGLYQLQAKNETIGLAVNPRDVFGDAAVSSVLIQDRSGNCLAVVLHGFVDHGFDEFVKLTFPKEIFLCENVYRSFFKFGEEIENPYYGNDVDNEFARLPDSVFIKILSYLPWRQRIQCGRVNKRLRAVANSVIAMDTKVIDLSNERYKGMRAHDLNVVLPIVSNHLEEIIWSNDKPLGKSLTNPFNFEDIGQVQLFPKLHKIFIRERIHNFDGFFLLLNKCPNLKELTAPIPRRPSLISFSPGPYIQMEKLCINTTMLTDPWLIEITCYFPKLISLHIDGYRFLTSSCISAVAEKYGEALTRLEIKGLRSTPAPLMLGAVTGFGSCPNLEYLSLVGTAFISDPCMTAVAAGCPKLTTLDICGSSTVTNKGLAALASLPNLKRLDLSNVGCGEHLSFGIAQLAKAGHLEQLLVKDARHPLAACLKTCFRYCRQLKLVDISGSGKDITIADAKEIIQLYGYCSLNSRLVFRSGAITWQKRSVRMMQEVIADDFNRLFVIADPQYRLDKKWAPKDDSDPDDYQCLSDDESDCGYDEFLSDSDIEELTL